MPDRDDTAPKSVNPLDVTAKRTGSATTKIKVSSRSDAVKAIITGVAPILLIAVVNLGSHRSFAGTIVDPATILFAGYAVAIAGMVRHMELGSREWGGVAGVGLAIWGSAQAVLAGTAMKNDGSILNTDDAQKLSQAISEGTLRTLSQRERFDIAAQLGNVHDDSGVSKVILVVAIVMLVGSVAVVMLSWNSKETLPTTLVA